jgi:hypothetical protein
MREIYSVEGMAIEGGELEFGPIRIDYDISFIDINNDSIFEIEENEERIILIDVPKENEYKYNYISNSTKKILCLKWGKYM